MMKKIQLLFEPIFFTQTLIFFQVEIIRPVTIIKSTLDEEKQSPPLRSLKGVQSSGNYYQNKETQRFIEVQTAILRETEATSSWQ